MVIPMNPMNKLKLARRLNRLGDVEFQQHTEQLNLVERLFGTRPRTVPLPDSHEELEKIGIHVVGCDPNVPDWYEVQLPHGWRYNREYRLTDDPGKDQLTVLILDEQKRLRVRQTVTLCIYNPPEDYRQNPYMAILAI